MAKKASKTTEEPGAISPAPAPTKALVKVSGSRLPVATMTDIYQIGKAFASSGMFGCKNAEQGVMLAMTCHMEGITPMEHHRRYHMIDGTPSMRADAMLAEFRMKGGKHRIIERTQQAAEVELERDGEKQRFRLTWAEAQVEPFVWKKTERGKKPLLKTNYATPRARAQMLWARVVSDGVRAFCPEVNAGVYTPEEVGDFSDRPIDITAEVEANGGPAMHEVPPAPEPAEPPASEPIDTPATSGEATGLYTVMPGGKMDGKPWSEMSEKQLVYVLENYKADVFKQGHKDAINKELDKRKEQADASK